MLFSDLLYFCHSPEDDGAGSSGPGGQPDDPSGDDDPNDENLEDDDDGSGDKPQQIAYKKHVKVVNEARNLRERLRALENAEKERTEADLKKKGDLESLLKAKETELGELKGKLSSFEAAITEGRKESALRKAIGKPLDPKWDRLLSSYFDQVAINEDGKIDAKSAKKLADDFSREYPEAFGEIRTPGSKPPSGNRNGGITLEQWKAMPSGPEKRAAMQNVID